MNDLIPEEGVLIAEHKNGYKYAPNAAVDEFQCGSIQDSLFYTRRP